jgi:hypothetical protein
MRPEDSVGVPDPVGMPDAAAPVTPAIRIVGDASPEQVAALLSVLSAAGGQAGQKPPARRSLWSAHSRGLRLALPHGPGLWRTSLRP